MNFVKTFKSIPQNRLVSYFIAIGLLPLALAGFFFMESLGKVEEIQHSIENLQLLALQKEKKQAANRAIRGHFSQADHFYIDKNLEDLKLLLPEIENLQAVTSNPNFTEDEALRKRLEFLTGSQNRLHFSESGVQSTPFFQEVVETLAHPVEVNSNDLKQILCLVESVEIDPFKPVEGKPQLLFLDFKLDKKPQGQHNETFELSMKLLKREFQ